jgi:hypothetical protein
MSFVSILMREKPSLALSRRARRGDAEGRRAGRAASCGGLMREKPSLALSRRARRGDAEGDRAGRAASCDGLMREKPSLALSRRARRYDAEGDRAGRAASCDGLMREKPAGSHLDARRAAARPYGMPHELPRVVIDLEKLRHINCGLGRFSLHLGEELLAIAPGRFQPVFFLPPGCGRYFPGGGFDRIDVSTWRKERLLRLVRPLTQPFLGAPAASLWHVTNQTSKYMPLDRRIPVVLTIHDLTFLHEAPRAGREREIGRKLAAIQAKVARSTLIATDSAYVADDVRRNLDVGARPTAPRPFSRPARFCSRWGTACRTKIFTSFWTSQRGSRNCGW